MILCLPTRSGKKSCHQDVRFGAPIIIFAFSFRKPLFQILNKKDPNHLNKKWFKRVEETINTKSPLVIYSGILFKNCLEVELILFEMGHFRPFKIFFVFSMQLTVGIGLWNLSITRCKQRSCYVGSDYSTN